MTKYLIRQMQQNDIDQIMKIEEVSFGTHHWSRSSFESEIENKLGNYISLTDGETGKLLGYAGFWLILDEAHITTIASHPDCRGCGFGELLLQHLIEKGYEQQAKWFTLEVRTSNIGAQSLYYKYGFKSLGLRPGYYQDNGEDALIMWTENIWESAYREKFNQLKQKLNDKLQPA